MLKARLSSDTLDLDHVQTPSRRVPVRKFTINPAQLETFERIYAREEAKRAEKSFTREDQGQRESDTDRRCDSARRKLRQHEPCTRKTDA